MFLAFTGIFEPSAILELPDGRFLVAEDEKEHPFALVTRQPDGMDPGVERIFAGERSGRKEAGTISVVVLERHSRRASQTRGGRRACRF